MGHYIFTFNIIVFLRLYSLNDLNVIAMSLCGNYFSYCKEFTTQESTTINFRNLVELYYNYKKLHKYIYAYFYINGCDIVKFAFIGGVNVKCISR